MSRSALSDPLEKYRFLVDFSMPNGAAPVRTGFHDIQMPKRATNKIMYREGQHPDTQSISAGLSSMEDIVMSRGVIGSEGTAANDFLKWASAVHKAYQGDRGVNSAPLATAERGAMAYRSEVLIKMLDREGKTVRQWKLYNAFPVNFAPGSDLAAGEDGEKSMESLTLAYEDFQELKTAAPDAIAGDAL